MSNDDEEANYFAMNLLMPESMVRAELLTGKYAFNKRGIAKLSDKFEVEEHIMVARLCQLGIMPGICR